MYCDQRFVVHSLKAFAEFVVHSLKVYAELESIAGVTAHSSGSMLKYDCSQPSSQK